MIDSLEREHLREILRQIEDALSWVGSDTPPPIKEHLQKAKNLFEEDWLGVVEQEPQR